MPTFGNKITQARNRLGLTQESLARQLDVSAQAVSKWEFGQSLPDPSLLVALADSLDLSLDQLLREDHHSRFDFGQQHEPASSAEHAVPQETDPGAPASEVKQGPRATVLKIDVTPAQHTYGTDTVHLRLPLSVIRGALRLGAEHIPGLLPEKISRHITLQDLSEMVANATPGTVLDAIDGEDHVVISLE